VEDMLRVEIDEELRRALREALSDMKNPVEMKFFTAEKDCYTCGEAEKIVKAVVDTAPKGKIRVMKYTWPKDRDAFIKYRVDRAPTIMFLDGGIRYLGLPWGEELKGFVETIIRLSIGESGLDKSTLRLIRELGDRKVYIEVIVTPPCPYCPYAALIANMLVYEARRMGFKNYYSVVVEAFENPDIADRYGVVNVPAIAVNGRLVYVGVPYEDELVKRIYMAAKASG